MIKLFPCLAVAAALAVPSAALADPLNGRYNVDGIAYVVSEDGGLSPLFGLTGLCGPRKIKSNGSSWKSDCNLNLSGIGDEKGKAKGKFEVTDGARKWTEKLRIKGKNRAGGTSVEFDWMYTIKYVLPNNSDTASYTVKSKICAEARGRKECGKSDSDGTVPGTSLNIEMTPYTICLDVTTDPETNKTKGTAKIETDAGHEIDVKVKGKYKDGMTNLKGKNKKGTKFKITGLGDDMIGLIDPNFLGNKEPFTAAVAPKDL